MKCIDSAPTRKCSHPLAEYCIIRSCGMYNSSNVKLPLQLLINDVEAFWWLLLPYFVRNLHLNSTSISRRNLYFWCTLGILKHTNTSMYVRLLKEWKCIADVRHFVFCAQTCTKEMNKGKQSVEVSEITGGHLVHLFTISCVCCINLCAILSGIQVPVSESLECWIEEG